MSRDVPADFAMTSALAPGSTLAIPVHRGRETTLMVLLRSIAAADSGAWYPRSIVLVTSDLPDIGSTISGVVPDITIPCHVLFDDSASTVGALRNRAARHVTTQWIHFMDSDTEAPRDYFTQLADAIASDANTECFQLGFQPADGASRWARYEAHMDRDTCDLYQSDAGVCGLNGMNFLIRAERLRAEPFREDLVAAEDVELGYRLHLRSIAARFLPQVVAVHHYPNSLGGLLRRKFWHGRGYVKAWPHMTGVYVCLPTAASTRASRARGTPMYRGYRKLAMKVFRAGMATERLRNRARHFALQRARLAGQ